MRRRTKYLAVILILFTLLPMSLLLLPWRDFASKQLHDMLQQTTGQDISFTLAELGLTGSRLRDIRLGGATAPVLLTDVTLAYSLPELWHGQLRDLQLNGLTLSLQETPEGWRLPAWQTTAPTPSPPTAAPVAPPLWLQPQQIPLQALQLRDGALHFQATAWQLALPFSLTWQNGHNAQLTLDSQVPQLSYGTQGATAGDVTAQVRFVPERAGWQGDWTIRDIILNISSLPTPVLLANGTLALDAKQLAVNGTVQDATKTWQAQFNFTRDHAGAKPALLRVARAQLPLLDGMVKLRDLRWPLDSKSPLQTTVMLEKIPLQPLLQRLTDATASATGTVSGTLPVTRHADGRLQIPTSTLETDTPGTLAVPAAYLPGDNEQIALLRAILSDLRYDSLRLTLSSSGDGKLEVALSINGRNPAVQNGKPVKLNVNLGGDVLGLLNNQLLSIIAPTQLLRNNHDPK